MAERLGLSGDASFYNVLGAKRSLSKVDHFKSFAHDTGCQ